MELYLFRPEEHHRLYNCNIIKIEDVPFEKRQHITEGTILILLSTIYYILYIPCIASIYRHMNNPCYKLLFYISIADCAILWTVGFVHGYFAITGAIFCSFPKFIYLVGSYIWAIWIVETSSQLILVINRCVSMLSSEVENLMFGGRRLYLWLTAAVIWSMYFFFFVPPVLFNGVYFSWLFNPYAGYIDDTKNIYVNDVHIFWDGGFAVGLPALYIVFSVLFFAKSRKMDASKPVSKQQKMMLLQVFIVSILNFITTSTYVSTKFIVPTEFMIHFAHYCLFHIHGLPPVIFLVFNPTIRRDAKQMLINMLDKFKKQKVVELPNITSKIDTSQITTNQLA